VDHGALQPALDAVGSGGVGAVDLETTGEYLAAMSAVDPDDLDAGEALAFWINVYNAGALALARRAYGEEAGTVLRVPGAFSRPFIDIAGERLSLDDVEHGKVRRFGDPRVHAALVCGSASCPTLRGEPYRGAELGAQLDDQMRRFLASGGARFSASPDRIALSRVFKWYGADFTRPRRMPTLLPTTRRRVFDALRPWIDPELAARKEEGLPTVEFQRYDWALGCTVHPPAPSPRGQNGPPIRGA